MIISCSSFLPGAQTGKGAGQVAAQLGEAAPIAGCLRHGLLVDSCTAKRTFLCRHPGDPGNQAESEVGRTSFSGRGMCQRSGSSPNSVPWLLSPHGVAGVAWPPRRACPQQKESHLRVGASPAWLEASSEAPTVATL